MNLEQMGQFAKQASYRLASLTTTQKNNILCLIAEGLEHHQSSILKANAQDLEQGQIQDLDSYLLDRLMLNSQRIQDMIQDIHSMINLPDPIGEVIDGRSLVNGLQLSRRRVPLGVVGAIYEARPNVTIDISCLCLKTGNAVLLRGGKETFASNIALIQVIKEALTRAHIPSESVQYLADPNRQYMIPFLQLDQYIDMMIPRGGSALHQLCKKHATIPVITGGIGICHMVIDESADFTKSLDVIENAKVQRPSVCNALDTLLVHRKIAPSFLPLLADRLAPFKVVLHGNKEIFEFLKYTSIIVQPLKAGDFDREWVSLNLNVKIFNDLNEAITHIRQHSSAHSESIITQNWTHAQQFINSIDSAALYVNASTRFTDGSQFGLGAEVAISTQKLHARGPMGLEALTTYKWIGIGDYLIRN